jgi:hypothetical protein
MNDIETPYKDLSKFDKFAEFKELRFSKCERNHGAIYLKALWLNDTEVLNEFERFGHSIHHIMLNKRTYDQANSLGYSEILFDGNGWLVEPKFIPIEVIDLKAKKSYCLNKIEVAKMVNNKYLLGIHFSGNTAGCGCGLSIWDDTYNSQKEAITTGLNKMIKWHKDNNDSIGHEIIKLAIEKLNELNDVGQLTLF